MLTVDGLLNELRRREVRIWSENGRLKFGAHQGILTTDLIAGLRRHEAAILERLEAISDTAPIPSCREKSGKLSLAQERMWLLWKLDPASPAYNVAFVVKLAGWLNQEAVIGSLQAVQQRHEVLRTHFIEDSQGASAVVEENRLLEVPVIDWQQGLSADTGNLMDHLRREATKPFDLTAGAPFEARLYRLDQQLHWLFLKMHHIVADAWSVPLLMDELSFYYRALDGGTDCALPELNIQYSDFALWQRARMQGRYCDRLLSYWKRRLDGELSRLRLATGLPRGAAKSSGSRVVFELPQRLSLELAEVALQQRATMFMVLLSAFRILLYRYTEQEDFLIGTPIICRNHRDTEKLIGYFGNTIVLRNPLMATDSYAGVLKREHSGAIEAYEHQELPFEMLAAELSRYQRGHQDLFQAAFSFAAGEGEASWSPGLRVEMAEVETSTAKFDLLLSMQETEGRLSGVFEYSTAVFDRDTVARMAEHLQLVLSDMGHNINSNIRQVLLLTESEKQSLCKWNATGLPCRRFQSITERFEAQAKARPQAVALYHGEERTSYAELNAEANRIAHRLLQAGVRPEQLVGVCLKRAPGLVASLLAVLKTGAAYVPIDPLYPSGRIKLILDECRPAVLITERALVDTLPEQNGEVLVIDEKPAVPDEQSTQPNPGLPTRPEELAYVLFTSGSTGRPKGVMIEHGSVANLLDWAYDLYAPAELAVVLAATSICFDLSVFEIFVPLCAGHSVVIAENALSLPSLPALHRITLINTVPSVMRVLLKTQGVSFPKTLQVVNLAGERLETSLVEEAYLRTHAAKVYDLYGPTEATTYSTFKLRLAGQPATIGRPISNARCYVVDRQGLPVPVGVPGELCLAGAGLARGYLHQPQLTAEKFVTPRSKVIAEERLYRTGDIVRLLGNGEIEYQGRNDQQVKVRGYRIELFEVRSALLTAEAVKDAWVTVDGDDGNEGREAFLLAYVTGDRSRLSSTRLRTHLRNLLPEFMVPSCFLQINEIPLTPNGKVDMARLEASAEILLEAGPDPPTTPTEGQILEIWRELLGRNHLGVNDDFFQVGGQSLAAIRMTARINNILGTDLPLQTILQNSTVSSLAAKVDALRAGKQGPDLPQLVSRMRRETPATLLQQHLWLVHHHARDNSFLNIANSLSLKGPLNLEAASLALRALVDRHSILRAGFKVEAGQLWQQPAPDGPIDVSFVDLSDAQDDAELDKMLDALYAGNARAFDLSRGPCARFAIARLPARDHIVLMVVHHIAADEWSLGILAREFMSNYADAIQGLPLSLPAKSLTFGDYACWQHECLARGHFEAQLSQWKKILSPPLRQLAFPWRNAACDLPDQVESYPLELDPDLTLSLAAIARNERTSLFVVLLSALKRLVKAQTGDSDVRVCTNIAARHHPGLENVVGPLTDTLILRTQLSASDTGISALRLVRDNFVRASGLQDLPFEEMASRLQAEMGIQRRNFAQVFFLFQEDGLEMPPQVDLTVESAPIGANADFFKSAVHDYDLILYLKQAGGVIRGQLTLKGQLDAGSMAACVVDTYGALLLELVQPHWSRGSLK